MTEKHVVKHQEQSPMTTPAQAVEKRPAPKTDTIFLPDVDIVEQADCFKLLADMPGVNQDSVSVMVENRVLTIEGEPHVEVPAGCELVRQEYEVGRYRRDFTLADSVNVDGLKAKLVQGVLEVTIPKRDEVRKKTVKIET